MHAGLPVWRLLQLGFVYQANLGNAAASAGWAAHAARLVDQFDLEPMRGWVLLIEASSCPDPGRSQTLASEARRRNVNGILLHAQLFALDFYKKHGYEAVGSVFMEGGIEHLAMQKKF